MKKAVVIVSVCMFFGSDAAQAASVFSSFGRAAGGVIDATTRLVRDATGIAVTPVYNDEARRAIMTHDYQKVAAMLESKAFGVNEVLDAEGNTPLMIAVNNARHAGTVRTDIIRLLLTYRSLLLNAKHQLSGDTALIIAARKGYSTIIKLLLHAGAVGEICNAAGQNAVAVARSMHHDHCAHLLTTTSSFGLWYTPAEIAHFAAEDMRTSCHCSLLDGLL